MSRRVATTGRNAKGSGRPCYKRSSIAMEFTLAIVLFAVLWLGLGGLGLIVARTIRAVEAGERAGRWRLGL